MIKTYFSKEGFEVDYALDGQKGIKLFEAKAYNLVILDLMMPVINGMDVLRIIRETSTVPILILSAKDNEIDKTLGLELGADDYVTKPFSMVELSARIRATIRRATKYTDVDTSTSNQIITLGNLKIDIENFSVRKKGQIIKLTHKEFALFKLFVSNPTRVYTKAMIYNIVWEEPYYDDDNVINVHMRRLREKIEDLPSEPKYIITLWGIGYKLGENL
jgi:DNA-binding response OmpR family regulator